MNFPGSDDYAPGCSPVRDLTLLEQIDYWKARAHAAEAAAWDSQNKLVSACEVILDAAADEDAAADWWKE
jgi:hypothetical protein